VLFESCPAATPFQSPEWLLAWLQHLGAGVELWTVLIRRNGRLVGLAPFYVYKFPDTGMRQLTLVGNGVTDRLDLLAEPASAAEVGRAVLEHLSEHRNRWDTADLRDLPGGSTLLSAPAPDGIADAIENTEACPVLTLPTRRLGSPIRSRHRGCFETCAMHGGGPRRAAGRDCGGESIYP
jgi:hypothetical protein